MSEAILTLLVNAVATPILVIITMAIRNATAKSNHRDKRDDNFIAGMERRIEKLEKELREVRVELKNRDTEYLELYKNYTTLKAKHEILEIDHAELKKKYEQTVLELKSLGNSAAAT